MKTNMKKFIAALFILGTTLAFSPAHAGGKDPETAVKFQGYKNSQPVYSLTIQNPENEKLTVTIRDMDGIVLYEEVLTGTTITRNYLLNRDDLGNNPVYFEVSRYSEQKLASIKVSGTF